MQDDWGEFEVDDPTAHNHIADDASDDSYPSPELSPSDDEVPIINTQHTVDIDLTRDIDDTPPPVPFDHEPIRVMRDDDEQGEYWCDHCTIMWPYKRQLHLHWESLRHRNMVNFLGGEPMFFCAACNWLPDMPHRHVAGKRHQKAARRLGRPPLAGDFALRQVVRDEDGRRVGLLINPAATGLRF